MKVAFYDAQGPAREVIRVGEVDKPQCRAGEILVRVHASGVNPSDVKYRSGWGGLKLEYPRVIPHNDGAGVVEAVGDGVDPTRVGERVWIYEAQRDSAFGTAAQFVATPAHKAVPLPEWVSFEEGAALGVPAMTAHRCLFADGPIKGQTVLITGGGGTVGSCAIQLAKWGGAARVFATASRKDSLDVARAAGADAVVNYKTEDVLERLHMLAPDGLDRVVEVNFAANIGLNTKALKAGGVVASYSAENEQHPTIPFYELMFKNVVLRLVLVYAMGEAAHAAAVRDISAALSAGALTPVIDRCFLLEDTAAAHEAVESGRLAGKAVITIS